MRRPHLVRLPILLALLALPALPVAATGERAADSPEALGRLADALGLAPDRLELQSRNTETLMDGRRIETIKALDRQTGEFVGASFENGRPVDRRAEVREAGEAWRALHGAITPGLRRSLDAREPGERLRIAGWLAVDLSQVGDAKPADAARPAESGTAINRPAPADEPASTARRTPAVDGREKSDSAARTFLTPEQDAARAAEQERIRVADDLRHARVRAAIAPVREAFLAAAAAAGLEVEYASEIAPTVVFTATREAVESVAFLPELDALYDGNGQGGPSLQFARPTQNVTPVNAVGYDGSGVAVSVTEGERGFAANPFLTWAGFYDGGQPFANHPTAVGGMIRSSNDPEHGLAGDVSLYSSNGSYSNFGVMSAAMDYGSTNARVLNNSWYWEDGDGDTSDFWEVDRHQDYFVRTFYDTVVAASGNFGNGCGGGFSAFVISPAKGSNLISVGNYDDFDNIGWAGDAMNICSSFGNPDNHNSTGTQEKPEISGVGTGIWSTTTADPWIGPVGSGTSYSSPMVASLAANVMEADAGLQDDPEALKSVLMATALHNIEGESRLSGVDGAGGIVGAAAAVSAERQHWSAQLIGPGTAFPITQTQFAYAGERVRFVVAWSSNPNGAYTTDPLPADIDVAAYREDGTTFITSSASFYNAYEIVDFIAPASETYEFRISLFSSDWSSGNTWMGTGWWRGEYRILPDVTYTDQHTPPLGVHLAVYPTDWTPTNYWRVMAIRPNAGSDYDLEVATRSLFQDPSLREVLDVSYYGTDSPDFITIDGNHWPASDAEHYRVLSYLGTAGYDLNFSNLGEGAGNSATPVILGPFTMNPSDVAKVVDVWIPAQSHRRVRVVPTAGAANLGLQMFRSDGAAPSSWEQERGEAEEIRNRSPLGGYVERLGAANPALVGDWLGLVVEKFDEGSVTFNVVVLPPSIFSDDFESADLLEWSSATTP